MLFRSVYTQSHIDYVVEIILEVWRNRERIHGLKLTHEAPFLRHFTAQFERLGVPAPDPEAAVTSS